MGTDSILISDMNGNLTGAYRQGMVNDDVSDPYHTYDTMDDYVVEYNGNQKRSVNGTGAGNPSYFGSSSFVDGMPEGDNEYAYNANGAMTKDQNKGINDITYDLLGNLREITMSDNRSIRYVYAADGTRLRTTHKRKVGNTYLRDSTEYLGNLIVKNGQPVMYRFSGGYFAFDNGALSDCHYYIQDYLGSNRMVVSKGGSVKQSNHYYPYGGIIGGIDFNPTLQPYKFEDKELDRTYGLDWYDIHARQYEPVVPSWHTIDPLAEKYYYISPYAYCANNPVNAIDTDGKWVWPVVSAAIDYGFQVFNNLQDGNNFADATFNNVNFSEVGLSAINPTGKFSTLKTLAVEAVKATVSISPTKGMEINNDISIVATKTLLNTGANKVAGKVVEKSSSASLTKANNELKSAVGNVKHAQTKIQQRTNAKGWEKTLEKSRASAVVAREKQVATQMLNSTVGQVNENISNSFISNGLQEIWKDWFK